MHEPPRCDHGHRQRQAVAASSVQGYEAISAKQQLREYEAKPLRSLTGRTVMKYVSSSNVVEGRSVDVSLRAEIVFIPNCVVGFDEKGHADNR